MATAILAFSHTRERTTTRWSLIEVAAFEWSITRSIPWDACATHGENLVEFLPNMSCMTDISRRRTREREKFTKTLFT